jgi:uncharacterized protein YaiE (UPF0345 family)
MAEFSNVTVVKKANIYFDGKVTSRSVRFADGSTKTLGIMLPGEYTFNTDAPENMDILAGDLEIQLPGSDAWIKVVGGEDFNVPGNSTFSLKIHETTDYCCSFLA